MRKQPFSKPYSPFVQKGTSCDRYSNYLTCQQNFPLQLKGDMKKHPQPVTKQNMKDLLNYQSIYQNKQTLIQDQNSHKYQIGHNKTSANDRKKQNSSQKIIQKSNIIRSALTQKIQTNNKLLNTSYNKSVIPAQDLRSNRKRPQSVRTFQQSRSGTGINYVMATDSKNLYKYVQKRHVQQFHEPRRQSYGKKCSFPVQNQQSSIQLRQNLNGQPSSTMKSLNRATNQNISYKPQFSEQNLSKTIVMGNSITRNLRISQDIHSHYQNKQFKNNFSTENKPKWQSQNQFKTGSQLGYQQKKQKKVGSQKISEMMGSQYHQAGRGSLRQKRDDWRRSTIVLN